MRIRFAIFLLLAGAFSSTILFAELNSLQVLSPQTLPIKQADVNGKAPIDFPQFLIVSKEAQNHRESRLVKIEEFLSLSKEPNTLILDTRSESAFKKIHLNGAIHLNFSDFTAEKLRKVIPDKTTRVLIYCNNNFKNGPSPLLEKSAPLALNIPTFINLYGYGYENLYELSSHLSIDDDRIELEGTEIQLQVSQDPEF